VAQTFGLIDASGNRIIQMVYEEVPKKAGKTEWAAGLALLVLVLSNDPGCPGLRRSGSDPAGDERIPGCLQNGRAEPATQEAATYPARHEPDREAQ